MDTHVSLSSQISLNIPDRLTQIHNSMKKDSAHTVSSPLPVGYRQKSQQLAVNCSLFSVLFFRLDAASFQPNRERDRADRDN